jgi:hypothetical protein
MHKERVTGGLDVDFRQLRRTKEGRSLKTGQIVSERGLAIAPADGDEPQLEGSLRARPLGFPRDASHRKGQHGEGPERGRKTEDLTQMHQTSLSITQTFPGLKAVSPYTA